MKRNSLSSKLLRTSINHGSKRGIGYLMEATVEYKHGILTDVDVYPANEKKAFWSCGI